MKRQDVLTIIITFTIGLFTGGYLFVVGFAPQVEKVSEVIGTDDKAEYAELTIIGTTYGGCDRARACASFQVRGDGEYSYLPGSITAGAEPVTGTLPGYLSRELRSAATIEALIEAAQVVATNNCNSYTDKNDYRYDVTHNTVVYDLDTCGRNLSNTSPLGLTLDKLWNYFETLDGV